MPSFRRLLLGLVTSLALGIAGVVVPTIPGIVQTASAQVSAEFQEALEPYGHWARSGRWGEVWVPDELPPDWRPYQYGHWVYTDEWGWYWISDPEEEDFGWVVYHYGRWAHDRSLGWFWIPDDEWGPAWVDWRYGGDYVGWAPLPPDEVIEEYDEDPTYWVFVSPRYMTHPRWRSYMVPSSRGAFAFRRTQVVNRSVGYGSGRAAVNPGISPAFVARASRAPVATFRVSPRVLAGTQGVAGAVRVSPQQLQAGRGGGQRGRRPSSSGANAVTVQRTSAVALPVGPAAPPPPLAKGQRGNLGTHPPRAAQGAVPAPLQQPQQRQQQQGAPPAPPPSQPQRAAPLAPVQRAAPPPPANAPPSPAQRREPSPPPPGAPPSVERRERPPEPQQRAPAPGPAPAAPPAAAPARPVAPQTLPPPAVQRPEPPRPPPPAAARPERPPPPPQEQRRPPPPPAAKPAPPPPPAAKPAPPPPPAAKPGPSTPAKPAPKPAEKKEDKKDEPPK